MNDAPKPDRPHTKPQAHVKHTDNSEGWVIGIVLIIVIGVMIYDCVALPDWPQPMKKIGNAIHDTWQNADRAELRPGDAAPALSLPASSP